GPAPEAGRWRAVSRRPSCRAWTDSCRCRRPTRATWGWRRAPTRSRGRCRNRSTRGCVARRTAPTPARLLARWLLPPRPHQGREQTIALRLPPTAGVVGLLAPPGDRVSTPATSATADGTCASQEDCHVAIVCSAGIFGQRYGWPGYHHRKALRGPAMSW